MVHHRRRHSKFTDNSITRACKCLLNWSCGPSKATTSVYGEPVTQESNKVRDDRRRRQSFSAPMFASANNSHPTTVYRSMSDRRTGNIRPAIEHMLECTLEELFYGHAKKIKITRDVLAITGEIVSKEELVTIHVKPGWKKGTEVTFPGTGSQRYGMQATDLKFVIAEKAHPLYKRDGDDLEMTMEVPLVEALTGCLLSVPLLGGDNVGLRIDEIIHPGYQVIVSQQGMPVADEEGKRGDLRIKFHVNFPAYLSDEQKSSVDDILHDSFSD